MRRSITAATIALALTAAAPAGAAVPDDGRFKGQTNLGQAFSLNVKDGVVSRISVVVQNTCGATNKRISVTAPIPIKGSGSFSAKLRNGADTFNINGRFSGDSVSGKLREKAKDPLFGQCDTKRVDFDASRA